MLRWWRNGVDIMTENELALANFKRKQLGRHFGTNVPHKFAILGLKTQHKILKSGGNCVTVLTSICSTYLINTLGSTTQRKSRELSWKLRKTCLQIRANGWHRWHRMNPEFHPTFRIQCDAVTVLTKMWIKYYRTWNNVFFQISYKFWHSHSGANFWGHEKY